MNNDIFKGQWNQLKGEVIKKWGSLTEDHLMQISGDRTKLVGKIQESYGIAREEAERQVSEWEKSYSSNSACKTNSDTRVA
jgi:uncharacterized protein YjbJ (UPF0337 family)